LPKFYPASSSACILLDKLTDRPDLSNQLKSLAGTIKRMKRFLLFLTVLFVILAGAALTFFFGVGYYLSPQSPLSKADVIVAISGGETQARTEEAVRLYNDGWAPNLIFSGAALDPSGPSNARTMAADARRAGVPASAIHLDETAANTRQNASGVEKIVHDEDYHSVILVTSPYHQRRAYIVFKRTLGQSFAIINHSSFDQAWRRSHWWATSESRDLTLSELQKVVYELISGGSDQ
jgi:uncharacterized SAM-binding protein YcdF (DUF218 family)